MKITSRVLALLLAMALCVVAGCSDKADVVSSEAFSKASSVQSAVSSQEASSEASTSSAQSSAISSQPTSSAVSSSAPVSSSIPHTGNTVNYLQNILDDMQKPHEGNPHGVPLNYDWAQKPRVGMGTDPGNFKAAIAWGQIYEDRLGNPATNTRVQVRNMQMYYFSKKQQKWIELQKTMQVEGNAYREDFVGDINKVADKRDESNNGGGLSVTAGDGYNFHFWPKTDRVDIDPTDIEIIYSTVQARLIVDDSNKPDDRSTARYLLSMGGDYWYDKSVQWAEFKTNGDFAIGRFKYVTNEWQAFNAWAGNESVLRNNPPPIE